ncbi:hypothetical protein [Paraburkholderia flagellata]|uniref:hypothetical protein n=1 Tax=Paraburkholderia flagellata TaxID=2883241 RepID=UPI001F37E6B6|nr:hypothetical protein [Paraburkholderia flagellata]
MADPNTQVSLSVAVVQPVGQLARPVSVLALIFRFRVQIETLLNKVATMKLAGAEIIFQETVDELPPENPSAPTKMTTGPDGFLTFETLKALMQNSGLLDKGESVKSMLQFFQTAKRRTWLMFFG